MNRLCTILLGTPTNPHNTPNSPMMGPLTPDMGAYFSVLPSSPNHDPSSAQGHPAVITGHTEIAIFEPIPVSLKTAKFTGGALLEGWSRVPGDTPWDPTIGWGSIKKTESPENHITQHPIAGWANAPQKKQERLWHEYF